jgi:hypothetical protein
LQGLLDLPARAGRALVDPTVFSGLLGAPTLPKERGIAQAAYGLPPEPNMSVLNPEQAAYMQGYAQGEPLSYLGLLAPFAAPATVAGAKAVAPQAGMALENYMARQGLIQPLTAYHGTPHTIQGQFDINKVGTGEGAQAYGYGMYFAENPAVAGEYKRKLSGGLGSPSNELMLNGQPLTDLTEAQRRAYEIVARDGRKNALGTAKDLEQQGFDASHIRDALNATKGNEISLVKNEGNLYKVDIPDADIPFMLDYDKPLLQQPPNVLKALQSIDDPYIQQAITTKPKLSKDGEYWEYMGNTYASKSEALEDATPQRIISGYTGLGKNPQEVSQALGQYGIKGVKYLDQSSRVDGKGTSNFVVFDPSNVKILEKNSEKVEGLLD